MQQQLFKIRDLRKKDQFKIDDKYLNGYARILGPMATCVYNSLSRHAEFHTQGAFPSEVLIAEEHGIVVRTVRTALKKLKEANIIKIERERTNKGKWLNNMYYLVDKIEWKEPEAMLKLYPIKPKKSQIKKVCVICGNNLIEMAHFIAKSEGGKGIFQNRFPLCPNHHTLFDNNKLSTEELQKIQKYQDQRQQTTYGEENLPRGNKRHQPEAIKDKTTGNKVPIKDYTIKDTNIKDNPKGLVKLPSYGKEDINNIINFLKEKLGGSLDGSQVLNRRFAKLLLDKMKRDYPDKLPEEQIKALIDYGLKDSFHGKNITSFKYLYYNTQKIIQSIKVKITKPNIVKIR